MKAVPIQEPYASAIIHGPKRVENRCRRLGLRRGAWYWVHAPAGFYFRKRNWPIQRGALQELWHELPTDMENYPTGRIIGAMRVGQTWEPSPWECGGWTAGPVATEISEVVALEGTYLAKGTLWLWSPSAELSARMTDELLNRWAELPSDLARVLRDEVGCRNKTHEVP